MTIYPGKIIKQQMIGIGSISAFITILFLAISPLFGVMLGGALATVFFSSWIASGKTIVMNEKGCHIHFLWYEKSYRWDELKTKRYVDYENCFESRSFADNGAEFSTKNVHIPKGIKSWTYSFFHPFSFFFVYFSPNERPYDETLCPIIYEVDGTVFREKMEEWHVVMDEVKRPLF